MSMIYSTPPRLLQFCTNAGQCSESALDDAPRKFQKLEEPSPHAESNSIPKCCLASRASAIFSKRWWQP
eukprot:1190663-Pleurochrysis_carterae.AAC.8